MRIRVTAAALAAFPCAACSTPSDPPVVPDADLQGSAGTFDPGEIVSVPALTDNATFPVAVLQRFLEQTPYGQPSFLATYSSNGLTAAESLVLAGQRSGIDPLALLVRAEVEQGLVASSSYPSPPARVEYAFGCGCAASGDCDAKYAGLDVQLRCLAASLRESLDQIAASGTTAGGWGPAAAATTLDGVSVTPADASTAALYQYEPVVAVGARGGSWIFWNVWHKFATALFYLPPAAPPAPAAWIGDPCASDGNCDYGSTKGTCDMQAAQGLCTLSCTASCPSANGEPGTFCAAMGGQGGLCLAVCNPQDPQCRSGYSCQSLAKFDDATTQANVCAPM